MDCVRFATLTVIAWWQVTRVTVSACRSRQNGVQGGTAALLQADQIHLCQFFGGAERGEWLQAALILVTSRGTPGRLRDVITWCCQGNGACRDRLRRGSCWEFPAGNEGLKRRKLGFNLGDSPCRTWRAPHTAFAASRRARCARSPLPPFAGRPACGSCSLGGAIPSRSDQRSRPISQRLAKRLGRACADIN